MHSSFSLPSICTLLKKTQVVRWIIFRGVPILDFSHDITWMLFFTLFSIFSAPSLSFISGEWNGRSPCGDIWVWGDFPFPPSPQFWIFFFFLTPFFDLMLLWRFLTPPPPRFSWNDALCDRHNPSPWNRQWLFLFTLCNNQFLEGTISCYGFHARYPQNCE